MNEFIFVLKLLELVVDGTSDYPEAFEPAEIRVFLCEDLKSAEVTIDGKNN